MHWAVVGMAVVLCACGERVPGPTGSGAAPPQMATPGWGTTGPAAGPGLAGGSLNTPPHPEGDPFKAFVEKKAVNPYAPN